MNSGEVAGLVSQLEQAMDRRIAPEQVEVETWLLNGWA